MQEIRLDSKDGVANGWAGVGGGIGDARNLPDRARASTDASAHADGSAEELPRRSWSGAAFRFARNAIVGLLLVTVIPVGIVGWRSHYLNYYGHTRSSERLERAEYLRPLMLPKDASITPMQAGLAFHAIQPLSEQDGQFPTVPGVVTAPARPWLTHKLTDDMFASPAMRSRSFDGPSPEHIIEFAPGNLSTSELAWLREVAEAPLWKNFDLVAAANAVDFVGGQYQIPFRPDAFAPGLPMMRYAGTKELAYAGISRAAYYLAIGQPAKAEAALQSIMSFGFAMIDNAATLMDAVLGQVIVNIGRNGFEQFNQSVPGYNIIQTNAPPLPATSAGTDNRGRRVSVAELHERLLEEASDNSAPRGVRMEQLRQLSLASCMNIPEMIFGPDEDTRAAFDNARKTLARYPSEQALLDMMLDATNRVPEKEAITNAPERLVMGAAAVASTITGNPRFSTCTRIAITFW